MVNNLLDIGKKIFFIKYIFLPVFLSLLVSIILPDQRYLAAALTVFVLFLYFILLKINTTKNEFNVSLFLASIALAGLSINIFKSSISEMLIIFSFILSFRSIQNNLRMIPGIIKVLFSIFIVFGLLTMLTQHFTPNPQTWIVTCILPLLIFNLVFLYIKNLSYAYYAINLSVLSVIIFIFITLIARIIGYAPDDVRLYTLYSYDQLSLDVKMGGFYFPFWANVVATLVVMIINSVFVFLIYADKLLLKIFYLLLFIILLYIMFLLKARSASVALIISLIILFFSSLRKNFKIGYIIFLLILIIIAFLIYNNMNIMISDFTFYRFKNMFELGPFTGSSLYRLKLIEWAIKDNTVLGVGFGTLWGLYRIDDATLYTWLINGTGLTGFASIMLLFIYLLVKYIGNFIKSFQPYSKFYVIGISTLLSTGIASYSDNAIMNYTFCVIPFWTILATCLKVKYFETDTILIKSC